MRSSHAILLVALSVALAAVALFAGARLLAPRREEPAVDFAGLAAAAARRVEAYGAQHGNFRHLRADSVLVALPPGSALRVNGDSTGATVTILHDGRARCSVRITRGAPLTQPRCRDR
jgi:hypothetical protein